MFGQIMLQTVQVKIRRHRALRPIKLYNNACYYYSIFRQIYEYK